MAEAEDLNEWFHRPPKTEAQRLGIVVGGSLSEGLDVKLDPRTVVIEGLAVGRYVVIRGARTGRRFFGLITDIVLDSTNPLIEKTPPDTSDPFMAEVYAGTSTFGRLHVSPMLVLDEGAKEPRPVKTVPEHFSVVYSATEEDVNQVFGQEDATHFKIGEPLDMEGIPVSLDLKKFVERSSGVFGKSGTGKTFLTRMLLAGIIQQDVAVNLVFDMHNEYGWKSQDESGYEVKGLRQLFPTGRVAVVTLDAESSRRRGSKVDFEVEIGYEQIEPEDVDMLRDLLGLTDVQANALYFLRRRLGKDWITKLLAEDAISAEIESIVDQGSLHAGTLGAIQRKLGIFRRFAFLKPGLETDVVRRILDHLSKGISVVIEFGRYGNSLEAYILVANFLTRRIHEEYVKRKEAALGRTADEPRPLVITIEEAHKFLDPLISRQTIFGTIARELRKYNVTLLVVDQRPSGIDEEVMSQIGTRVTCLLDNEADIRAVLSGVSGTGALREVLARLDTRQQALILGHAVPMPVVVKTRDYRSLYAALAQGDGKEPETVLKRNKAILRGEGEFEGFD